MPTRPHAAPMTESYRAALHTLAADGSVLGRRVYPNPYTFVRVRPNGSEYHTNTPAITVDALLEDGYMTGEAPDFPLRDTVRFTITPAGRRGWLLDAPAVDPTQLAMFADEATAEPRTAMEAAA